MVTYTIYMKELSASTGWQDVTHAVVLDKGLPVRKGFGALSDAIDVGSVSLTVRMESLQEAALLHVSQKQVLIQKNGVTIFEGLSYDDASVDLNMNTDYVYAKLKFKPYSSAFKDAKVPEDTVLTDVKVCDPTDTNNSLLHILFNMIVENLPGQLPDILSGSFSVSTAVSNTKVLELVILENGENLEDYLTQLLYQNGYAYYMDLFSIVVIEPYLSDRVVTAGIPITDILAKPSISQAPYIVDKKCVVRFPRVEQYTDETVYELNAERYDDSGEPTQVDVIEPGAFYPLDSDGEPITMEADYGTERETDDIELVYTEGQSLSYVVRTWVDPEDPDQGTVPAVLIVDDKELKTLSATFRLYNNNAYQVSLRNVVVKATTAYYRNWETKYEDTETASSETEEIDGLYMPDADTAKAFVKRYRAEAKAQRTQVTFQTHVVLAPNSLVEIAGLPYQLLIRYRTEANDGTGYFEYDAVAFLIEDIVVGGKIKVFSKRSVRDGGTPVPVSLYALGDLSGPFAETTRVADDFDVLADDYGTVGMDSTWSPTIPTPAEGQYIWTITGYYIPPATWPSTWTEPIRWTGEKGNDGEPARMLVLRKLPDNIIVSSRGTLKTEQVVFTAELQNLPLGTLVWARSDGGELDEYEIAEGIYDPLSRILDASTVDLDSVSVTVSTVYEEETYTATASVMKISEGQPIPQPLGALPAVPTQTPDGDPLVYGDHFTWDAADSGIFEWGHSYVFKGLDGLGAAIWEETENFVHLSGLAKENIEMSKREDVITHSRVVFSEYIFATKIEVLDELVANYEEDADGIPTKGSRVGADGKMKTIDLEAWNSILHGLIKSDALDTQNEDTNVTPVPATSSPTSLWNEKALYDLFPVVSSQYLQAAVFDWATFSYTKATKVNGQKIIYDRITGPTSGYWGTGGVTQIGADYTVPAGMPSTEFEVAVSWGWNTFVLIADSYLEVWRGGVKIRTHGRNQNSQSVLTLYQIEAGDIIKCFVDWGFGYIELTRRYIEVRTRSTFSGIAGLRSDNYLYAIPISQDVTKWHAYSWSGAGVSTASILQKASGTPVVEACEDIGEDYVQCSGTMTYEGTPYTVDRVRKSGGSVYFYSGTKLIQIDAFSDGTAIGIYSPGLAISVLTLYSQLPAALVRYLIPKLHGTYDLGQSGVVTPAGLVDRFFRNMFLTGIGYMDKINTGLGDTKVYPQNQSLLTTASPTFADLAVTSVSTGNGVTKVYKETYETFSLSALNSPASHTLADMEIGETKRLYYTLTSNNDGLARVILPTGGTYARHGAIQPPLAGGTNLDTYQNDSSSSASKTIAQSIWRVS
ncbi:MAG: hypothetical protein VB025_07550 [Sphaerochaeta sp.]|nr:hypothetical protein [Sphaerochaeta sp.]